MFADAIIHVIRHVVEVTGRSDLRLETFTYEYARQKTNVKKEKQSLNLSDMIQYKYLTSCSVERGAMPPLFWYREARVAAVTVLFIIHNS